MTLSSGISKVMSGADWLMLIGLSLLWGGSFFFNDIAVRELPTITVVTVRVRARRSRVAAGGTDWRNEILGEASLVSISGHGDFEQCDPFSADRVGADPNSVRSRGYSQRHDAAFYRRRRASVHRR